MHDRTVKHGLTGHPSKDPEGFERFIPPMEEQNPMADQTQPVQESSRVIWEYTYSRFGRPHGPHQIEASTLPEAKDQIRRRHQLPDYRGIRVNAA